VQASSRKAPIGFVMFVRPSTGMNALFNEKGLKFLSPELEIT
jgi:hypothetical protein